MPKPLILLAFLLIVITHSAVIQNTLASPSSNYYESLYRNYVIETNRQRIQQVNQQGLTFKLEANRFMQYSQAEF